MSNNIIFYIVFLSQIILLSYYYPKQILNQIGYVLKTCPPSEYPKLYPKDAAYYKIGQFLFKSVTFIILAFGFIALGGLLFWNTSSAGKISEAIPTVYFFVQMAPIFLMEIFGFAYFKLMRKADSRSTRKAELHPRRLFDYVSPIAVVVAIFMFLACIAFFYSLSGLEFAGDNDTFVIIITLALSNLLFGGIIFWNLYGKKLDPYQAGKDRRKQLELTIKSMVYVSIVASTFLIVFKGINVYNLDSLEPVLMSIYFQIIVYLGLGSLLRNQNMENIDFEVYKKDMPVT